MQFLTIMMLAMMATGTTAQTLTLSLGSTAQATQAPVQSLIANGDFSTCACQSSSCPVTSNTIIPNWTPDCSSIEVGYGYLYNNLLSSERVVAPSKNTCLKQQLCNLKPGYYQVAVQYTALQNQLLSNCQFGVVLNGVLLKTITPTDYTPQTQLIDVQVANGCAPMIKVCGLGADEGSYGAIIKSVNVIWNQNPLFGANFNPIVIDSNAVNNAQNINVLVPNVNFNPIQSPNISVQAPAITLPPLQQPSINVQLPTINVPVVQQPNFNVKAPEIIVPVVQQPNISIQTPTINVPVAQPPNIYVQAPEIIVPAVQQPDINLQTSTINVPTIQTPNINLQTSTINVPLLQPPKINVQAPAINLPLQPSTNFQAPIINVATSNPPGIYIDSTSSQSYQKQYQFQGGDIVISFTFNVLTTAQLINSALFVTVDNQQVYKVSASKAGQTITVTIPQLSAGVHVIGLTPFKCPTEPAFTFYIPNFTVQQKICSAQWGSDLITNGNFQTNTCQGSWCIWNQNTFQSSYLPGWTPNPEIEIGTGCIYNSAWGTTQQVSELDSSQNTCIIQQLSLKSGTYNLKFDWAARAGTNFATNGLQVTYNGQMIKTISPCDYNIHTQTVQFTLPSNTTNGSLQFCGTGTSDSYGTAISNIKLFYYNQCGNYTMSTC